MINRASEGTCRQCGRRILWVRMKSGKNMPVGAAVHSMIDAANEKMDDAGFDPDMDWTYLAKVFGSAAIPVESAEVIKKALKKAEKDGTITSKNKWQMIEYWAADYLAGK